MTGSSNAFVVKCQFWKASGYQLNVMQTGGTVRTGELRTSLASRIIRSLRL